jgi:tRNA threonylcarbamoyl adenosine modification protein YeaZ
MKSDKSQSIILLDTSDKRCDFALSKINDSEISSIKTHSFLPKIGLTEELDFELRTFLEKENQKFSEIKYLVCSTGPGSFTGLRTGISFSQGIAFGLRIPIFYMTRFLAVSYYLLEESKLNRCLSLILRANKQEFFSSEISIFVEKKNKTFELSKIGIVSEEENLTEGEMVDISELSIDQLAVGYMQGFVNIRDNSKIFDKDAKLRNSEHFSIWEIGDPVQEPHYIKGPQALTLEERGIKSVFK